MPFPAHLALPLRLTTRGSLAQNEQDSLADVETAVEVVTRTPTGQRRHLPDFGVPDQTFSQNGVDPFSVQVAISRWEPRASVSVEDIDEPLTVPVTDRLRITVTEVQL